MIAGDSARLQPVHLQKTLFLLGRNLSSQDLLVSPYYRFDAYDYGPFCADIYRDAEDLEALGLVSITRPPVSRYKLYSATASGQQRAQELHGLLSSKARSYLTKLTALVPKLSFEQLVAAVYAAYPEMKANSVFKDPT